MSLPNPLSAELTGAAPVFAALGDKTRLALVNRLSSAGPLSIVRLTDVSNLSRQAITRHLYVLADAGLVRDVKRGREHIWELDTNSLFRAQRSLDQISRQWDEALARLKSFVEESP